MAVYNRPNNNNGRMQGFGANHSSAWNYNDRRNAAASPCAEPMPEKEAKECEEKSEACRNAKNTGNPFSGIFDSAGGLLSSFFGGKKPDSERLLLIFLLIMLAREDADIKLLIAVGYLLA